MNELMIPEHFSGHHILLELLSILWRQKCIYIYPNMFYCELMQAKEGSIVSAPAPLVRIGSSPSQDASHHQNCSTFNRGAKKKFLRFPLLLGSGYIDQKIKHVCTSAIFKYNTSIYCISI